jgi:hypothetical protein
MRRIAWPRTPVAFVGGYAAGWTITLMSGKGLATMFAVALLALQLAKPRHTPGVSE